MDTTSIQTLTQFYNDAFNHLITYTTLLIGVVGVVVPIVIAVIQNKSLAKEIKELEYKVLKDADERKNELGSEVDEKITISIEKYKSEIDGKFNLVEEKLNKKISCLEASTFHIQGNDMLGKELFASAISDYVVATKYYLTGNDEQNGRIVLGNILKALRLVTKNSYIEDQVQVSIDDLIKDLEGRNVYGRYSKDVSDIKKECKAALLREPPQAIAKV